MYTLPVSVRISNAFEADNMIMFNLGCSNVLVIIALKNCTCNNKMIWPTDD
jgi:hypothetical protein